MTGCWAPRRRGNWTWGGGYIKDTALNIAEAQQALLREARDMLLTLQPHVTEAHKHDEGNYGTKSALISLKETLARLEAALKEG